MNYKNKYLKYKLKYLNLRGGSNYEEKEEEEEENDDFYLDDDTERLVLNEQDIKFEEQILGTELLYSLPENLYNFLSFVSTPFSRLFGFPPEQTSDFPLGDVTDDVIELENRRDGQLPRLVGDLPLQTGQENEYLQ
jgi:hypothetical protein